MMSEGCRITYVVQFVLYYNKYVHDDLTKQYLLNFMSSSCHTGSSRDIGMYMTRIILRHREVGRVVTTMARMLHNSVTVGIQSNMDKWRKSVGQLERKHNKHYKSARSTLQRKSETLGIMLLKTKIINCRCQLARTGETENPPFI